jgi:hypothetical protein
MWVTAPLSWPMGRLLDYTVGAHDTGTVNRRQVGWAGLDTLDPLLVRATCVAFAANPPSQLKALVSLHAKHEGLGGQLSPDEIKVRPVLLDSRRATLL